MIKVKSRRVVWVDVTVPDAIEFVKLLRDFVQWQIATDTFPVGRGSTGPLGFSGGFAEADAKRVLAWWRKKKRDLV